MDEATVRRRLKAQLQWEAATVRHHKLLEGQVAELQRQLAIAREPQLSVGPQPAGSGSGGSGGGSTGGDNSGSGVAVEADDTRTAAELRATLQGHEAAMHRTREETLQAAAEESLLRRFLAFDFHVETVRARAESGGFCDLKKKLAKQAQQWEVHRGSLASDVLLRLDKVVKSPSHIFRPLIGGLSVTFYREDGTKEEGVDENGLTVEMFSQVYVPP